MLSWQLLCLNCLNKLSISKISFIVWLETILSVMPLAKSILLLIITSIIRLHVHRYLFVASNQIEQVIKCTLAIFGSPTLKGFEPLGIYIYKAWFIESNTLGKEFNSADLLSLRKRHLCFNVIEFSGFIRVMESGDSIVDIEFLLIWFKIIERIAIKPLQYFHGILHIASITPEKDQVNEQQNRQLNYQEEHVLYKVRRLIKCLEAAILLQLKMSYH